jgi:hypothetical protein
MKHRDEIRLNITAPFHHLEKGISYSLCNTPPSLVFSSDSLENFNFFVAVVMRVYFKELYTSDEID